MAITTYAELQTAASNWTDRTDLTALIPDFITLGEAWMQRNLRVRQMQTTALFTTVAGTATLPTDFLMVRAVTWLGSPVTPLNSIEIDEFNERYGSSTTVAGPPRDYAIQGTTISTGPPDNTASIHRLTYYQKIPVLSASNTSNWVLTAYPDLYLFATLTEMELFGKDGNEAGTWKLRREATLNEINTADNFNFRGPAPQIRLRGINP